MKKLLTAIVLILLLSLPLFSAVADATQTVYLPDQEITVRVYGNAGVQRTPNTIIRSFTSDQNVAWAYASGIISGDKTGTTTALLKEYDAEEDILYITNVKVTVLPRDTSIDYERDQSANSTAVQHYTNLNGHIFPVGMKYSFAISFSKDGQALPVTYTSSNPEVAAIDSSGMVTMKAAGTSTLTAYCKELQTGQTLFITVYSANTGGNMYGYYEPEDPGATTKVYAKPDKSSKVLYTLHSNRYGSNNVIIDGEEINLIMHTLEKGPEWSKVTCQLGTGYVLTGDLSFASNMVYDAPALEENATFSDQSDESFRTYTVGGTVYATDRECDMYVKPDKASSKLLTVPVNDTMTVLEETGSWIKVKYNGKTGYVTLFSVSAKPVEDEPLRQLSLPTTMYTTIKLPLFSQPGARGRIADYAQNTAVLATAQHDETWILVEVNGETGYMHQKYLSAIKPETVAPPPEEETPLVFTTMVVQTGNSGKLYMRNNPSTKGKVIGKYANGTQIKVINIDSGWATVFMNNQTGYMMAKFLQPLASQPYQHPEEQQPAVDVPAVTAIKTIQTGNENKLNLRSAPRSSASVLTRFPNGTQVEILNALDSTWDHVRVNGQTGYMMDRYLTSSVAFAPEQTEQPQPPEQTIQSESPAATTGQTMYVSTGNDGKLNLRSKMDARSISIERYPNGTQVTVLETSGSWAKVKVNGRTGYMMVKFLSATASAAPQQPAPVPEVQNPSTSASACGAKTVQTGNDGKLNLRNKPGSGAKILGQYPNGTQVEIIDAMNSTWDLVRVDGQTGYMMDRFLN